MLAPQHPPLDVGAGGKRLQVEIRLHHQPGSRVAAEVARQPLRRVSRDAAAFPDGLVDARGRHSERRIWRRKSAELFE